MPDPDPEAFATEEPPAAAAATDGPLVSDPAAPIAPPTPQPSQGWLLKPAMIACWVNTTDGKIVQLTPAYDYTVLHGNYDGSETEHDYISFSGDQIPHG